MFQHATPSMMSVPDAVPSLYTKLDTYFKNLRLPVFELTNASFKNGTLYLSKSGRYVLTENIVYDDPVPRIPLEEFEGPTVLGDFCAIAITGKDIILDLNGYSISQSFRHSVKQRFFALIELASTPFIPGQGPANFGKSVVSAERVLIHNGRLGLSAHHGIHGNGARDILLRDLDFSDYEVAAISLNGCNNLVISDVNIHQCRQTIPVNGFYSNAVFLYKYLNKIIKRNPEASIRINNTEIKGTSIASQLQQSVQDAYTDMLADRPVGTTNPDSLIYRNTPGYLDANVYGILVKDKGFAVPPFQRKKSDADYSTNIVIQRVNIDRLVTQPREFVGFSKTVIPLNANAVPYVYKGPAGEVLALEYWRQTLQQIYDTVPESQLPAHLADKEANLRKFQDYDFFKPTVLFTAQAFILKHASTDFERGTCTQDDVMAGIINWIEQTVSHSDDAATGPSSEFEPPRSLTSILDTLYAVPNIDIMVHSMKGNIGIMLQGLKHVTLTNISISRVHNLSEVPADVVAYKRVSGTGTGKKCHATESPEHWGTSARGLAIAASEYLELKHISIADVYSENGFAVGMFQYDDCQLTKSDIKIKSVSSDMKLHHNYLQSIGTSCANFVKDAHTEPKAVVVLAPQSVQRSVPVNTHSELRIENSAGFYL